MTSRSNGTRSPDDSSTSPSWTAATVVSQVAAAVVLVVEVGRLDERAVDVDLAAEIALRERRAVVRDTTSPRSASAAALCRPPRDSRDDLGGGQPAADDDDACAHAARSTLYPAMAVVIASSLRKELSGTPLFDGVSFSVERGDVVALSGPNGAGKTTLLRMITGETSVSGGEVAFAKGTRIALHDQRPPLQQGLTLREYALSGAADLIALEDELRALEAAMADGSHDPATLRRYADAQARLEHGGGWDWRERAASGAPRARLSRRGLRPPAGHVLRRRADPRVAGPRARRRPRSPAARRADEPSRRAQPRVAREDSSPRSTPR